MSLHKVYDVVRYLQEIMNVDTDNVGDITVLDNDEYIVIEVDDWHVDVNVEELDTFRI